jgi:hypothetical protein
MSTLTRDRSSAACDQITRHPTATRLHMHVSGWVRLVWPSKIKLVLAVASATDTRSDLAPEPPRNGASPRQADIVGNPAQYGLFCRLPCGRLIPVHGMEPG